MKKIVYHINGQEVVIRLSGADVRVTEVSVDGNVPEINPADMPAYVAATALALLEYEVEEVHDTETDILTLGHKKSPWSSPGELMSSHLEVSDAPANAQLPVGEVI
ncbi:MAG: hypothetical protein IJ816_02650 [Alloprevotella sp.]|nr:hypothetical protein [Alloprevotella sp.]